MNHLKLLITSFITLGVAVSSIQVNGNLVDPTTLNAYLNAPSPTGAITANAGVIVPVGQTIAGSSATLTPYLGVSNPVISHAPTAINATAAATAAQVATGYITSTSAAGTTITLPTGTLLGAALNAVAGTIHKLYIDNTAGASVVTMAVAVNGILSAAAAAGAGGGAGLLTVPAGVTGQGEFTLMFSSATAYTFSRTA